MTALPTIHLNGTGADTLQREYRDLRKAVDAAAERLTTATCNPRDFYPQEPGAWQRARDERAEMFRLLQTVSEYAQMWEFHAMDHRRGREVA